MVMRSWDAETEQEVSVQQDSHTQAGKKGNERNTLFLQNRTGVLKVGVTITSFPVVAAPPATASAPDRSSRSRKSHQTAGDVSRAVDGWRSQGGGTGEITGQAGVSATHPPK